ncbi:IS66 family insertion sequence element accessory protein TnpB [Yunchengibacter salinarum]|uniref:IS66 family insertion sequence element accessory protein TnpB n=1 Tax=Yunchengibacter salinarum TaxID=3133399 RepID=UPI0035B64424
MALTLYRDGQGFCLYYKVLERGRFPWPSAGDGAARLTSAQLAMLWEGLTGDGLTGAPRRRGWDNLSPCNALFLWHSGMRFAINKHVANACKYAR